MFTLLLSKWLNRVLHDLIWSILSYNRQEVLRPLEVFSTTLHRGKKRIPWGVYHTDNISSKQLSTE